MTATESIRSGRGFGDSLYLQSIARHLVENGKRVEVCTNYPDVFLPLKGKVQISPFRRERISRVAHYIARKSVKGTDQFVDCCISAGLHERVAFGLDWAVLNAALRAEVRRSGLPVVVVQMPRLPMDRKDGYGADLLPDCRALQRLIDRVREWAFVVQVGQGDALHQLDGIDLDLANRTSVADVIDVVSAADACVGYCSFIVPLAESLNKPALLVWSRRGLNSRTEFIRQITPEKIFHRASSRAVMDDCSEAELSQAADALYRQIRVPALV